MKSRRLSAASVILICAAAQAANGPAQREFKFGVKMAREGIWREAAFRWQRAARDGEPSPRLLNNLAVAYEKIGEYDLARDTYERALERAPDDRTIRQNHDQFMRFYEEHVKPGEAGEDGADAP